MLKKIDRTREGIEEWKSIYYVFEGKTVAKCKIVIWIGDAGREFETNIAGRDKKSSKIKELKLLCFWVQWIRRYR
jgi:hypothetical protein